MSIVWLERDVLLALHDAVVATHGGAPGIADYMGLEMVRARPMDLAGRHAPSVPDLAAAQLCGILLKRPFRYGNKRTAAAVLEVFLSLNDYELAVPEEDLAYAVRMTATGDWTPAALAEWLNQSVRRLAI